MGFVSGLALSLRFTTGGTDHPSSSSRFTVARTAPDPWPLAANVANTSATLPA